MKIKCARCGAEFAAVHPGAAYCSGRCRVAAHRARNRPAAENAADRLKAENTRLKAEIAQLKAEGKEAIAKAEPVIDASMFSMSQQQKLDAAIRQYKRKLDLVFKQHVTDEVRRRIDEIVLPSWKQRIDQAQELFARRRALMNKETFNTIRRALHPDSRGSISDNKLSEAFDAFMALEKYLLNEKDSPTKIGDLPSSLAEWDKMRINKKKPTRQSNGASINGPQRRR